MQIREKLEKWAEKTLERKEGFMLTHPKDLKNGDYTLIINNKEAEEDFKKLEAAKISYIEKVEFVAPRFVNIYLSVEFFGDSVADINSGKEDYGKTAVFKGRKTMVEYTDPNIMKPFHIGHLMSNTIGESISRLYEKNGADVIRANYYSDSGVSIAKAVWGIKQKISELPTEETSLSEKADFLGKCYAFGVVNFENEKIESEIREINKKIFDRSDDEINKLYDLGKRWSLENFSQLYKKLGSEFEWVVAESEVVESGKEIVLEFLKKGIFEESEGAIIFKGENFNPKLHTRVFISKDGLPTYEAKEIGLTKKKFSEYDLDESVVITANEQNDYFRVVLGALSLIDKKISEKTKHLSHGMLRLPTGKMSSRTGDVITAENLIEQIKEKVFEKLQERDYSEEEKREILEIVAIGAVKFSILRQSIGGDIIFDFDKSISFEGDSGPYLQYGAVRAKSVLETAGKLKINADSSVPEGWQITDLERVLYRFPEVVERAGAEYAPHHLVTYLTELAGIFNSFYAKERIAVEGDSTSPYKVSLALATFNVLKSGLNILGIKVPERM